MFRVAIIIALLAQGGAAHAGDDETQSSETPPQEETQPSPEPEAEPAPATTPLPVPETAPVPELRPATPKISGYFQAGAAWGPEPESGPIASFFLRRVRINVRGEILGKDVTYAIQVDPLSSKVRDAYAGFGYIPGQQVRVGQFKIPFGWENPTSSTALPTIERALVSDHLGRGPDSRDIGAGIFGRFSLSSSLAVENGIAVVNGSGANTPDATEKKDAFGRVGIVYRESVRVGVSAATVQYVAGGLTPVQETSTRVGADVQVDVGPVFFVAEYIQSSYSEPEEDLKRSGFHATVLVRSPFGLEGVLRFEQYRPDHFDDSLTQRRVIAGVNYYVKKPWVKVLVNYRHDLEDTDQHLALGQLQVVF